MTSPLPIITYVAFAAGVAFLGRNTVVGFAGCFVLGLLLTPFVIALSLMIAMPRSKS